MEADPAKLWSERIMPERATAAPAKPLAVEPPKTTIVTETIVWEAATLTWSPGSGTLTAACNGQKAELKLSGDRSIVPAELHKKLFDKKDAVKAKVSVEKQGNLYKITTIENK